MSNDQFPISNQALNPNDQTNFFVRDLGFGICLVIGHWKLEFVFIRVNARLMSALIRVNIRVNPRIYLRLSA